MGDFAKKIQVFLFLALMSGTAIAQNNQSEEEYYKMTTLPVPKNISLEVGGLTTLPNGSLGVVTREGEIWIVEDPSMTNHAAPYFRKFASGLHEPLGLAYKDGSFYVVQRSELDKITDVDGDGKADKYETIYRWPLSGNYHEYSYGPVFAPDGSMFVTTNLGFPDFDPLRGKSWVPWRGWTLRITPDGKMEPWATGMRSPCGTGWIDSSFFYVDNQGDWIGSGGLVQVEKGNFTGNPAGLDWADQPNSPVKVRKKDIYAMVDPQLVPPGGPYPNPVNKEERGVRLFEVAEEVPGVKTPAVWLPHGVLGVSLSQIMTDGTEGKFGPFTGQVFIGDMGQSRISRVFLEKVKGVYQGAAFDFRSGFQSGVLRMAWGHNGELYVGQTRRGWPAVGPDPFGLQSLAWTGKVPFEMKAVRAMPDGFDIEFTLPVDKASAQDPASYSITSFLYKYHAAYGSPVVDDTSCAIKGIVVSEDGMHVRLAVDGLRKKYIHEIKLEGVTTRDSAQQLLHNTAYYTLNEIPDGQKLSVTDMLPVHHQMNAMNNEDVKKKNSEKAKNKVVVEKKNADVTVKRLLKMPADWKAPDKTIVLTTQPGLKFDQDKITIKAGSKIKWVFRNKDDMEHNCVIVMPGTGTSVGEQALKMGLQGEKLNYVPDNKNVLFHTKLIGPGDSDTIYFVAPDKPGEYTYVCTYPGHYTIMHGILEVVK